jgi:quercetin dioxygenase-like cupin family protein
VFGYVLEGEMLFELEGEPPRVIEAGEAFWEPGGDVIHYSDATIALISRFASSSP